MLNIGICDDDSDVCVALASWLNEYAQEVSPEIRYHVFSSGLALLDAVSRGESYDALFMDVMMEHIDGLETARSIRVHDKSAEIIIMSSSPEFAIKGYSVQASNYLLKPVSKDVFFAALDDLINKTALADKDNIAFRESSGSMIKFSSSSIMYCEVIGHCVMLFLTDGKSIRLKATFSEVLRLFDGHPEFVQPHRSYLVNLNYVHKIYKGDMHLISGKVLPISRGKQPDISERFMAQAFSQAFK